MSKLFESFIPTDDAVWKKLTEEELKGADINALPLWKESDGFSAHPAYFRSETEKLPMFGQTIRPLRFNQENNDWLTCCDVLVKDAAQANEEILHKLDLGASALTIDLNGKDFARDEIDILFQGVVVSAISISFYHAFNALRFQADYFDWAQKHGMSPASLKGGLWFDDLNGDLALALVRDKRYHSFGAIGLDGGQFYAKGANIPQQLGATLAWGNEILNGLRLQGLSFEDASNNIGFSLAVGSSFLPEIAKFRLMRFLWARVMQQHGASDKRWKTWVHAQTGLNHQSSLDTPVNLLRANAQAMSAVLGGVDSLTVHPFRKDEPELAERIALNTQHIMRQEAVLMRVIDPAAGSYYVEHLTDIIGRKAWEFFKLIEEKGGYSTCKAMGYLKEEFSKTDTAYAAEVEKLERVLIGVNKYPSPFEASNDKA